MRPTDAPALVAGVAAGLTGLVAFLTLHWLWIMPIWFILPVGMLVAGSGGLAVGWAYAELQRGLPKRPWRAAVVVALLGVILLPAFVLAELRGPVFTVTSIGPIQTVSTPEIVARFIGDLLATATLVGALVGGWLGRTRRAALATAVAGFLFALGPGHNIPLIGGTTGVGKEVLILSIATCLAASVLVAGHAWLASSRLVPRS